MDTSRSRIALVFSLVISVAFSACASLGANSLNSSLSDEAEDEDVEISACLINTTFQAKDVHVEYFDGHLADIGTAYAGQETYVSSDDFPPIAKTERRIKVYLSAETESAFEAEMIPQVVNLSDGTMLLVDISGSPSIGIAPMNQVSKFSPCYEDIAEED